MNKEKIVFEEGFKKPYPELFEDCRPIMRNLSEGFKLCEARILKQGVVKRGDQRLEFQDLRLYLKEEGKEKNE